MTKTNAVLIGVVGALFLALGAYVGTRHKEAPPVTTVPAPQAGPRTPVQALFAQSMADASGASQSLLKSRIVAALSSSVEAG